MTWLSSNAETRAARLVRWYPREWRARYGDEFSELLAAQIADQPRSWARGVDVIFGAFMARLAAAGLSGSTVDPSDQPQRSLATLGCALAAFMTLALSIWSHLTVARRWATSVTPATHTALAAMTIGVIVCVAAAGAASIPLACTATWAAVRNPDARLRNGALLFLTGAVVLIAGALVFHNGWPSTGTEPLVQQSAGPNGLASFVWISTLAVSAYWAHPTILVSLPASELAWMVINPIALTSAVMGVARILRRLDLSSQLVRFVTWTGQVATAGLGLFLVGTVIWLVDGSPGPGHLFQAGTVDEVGLVLMAGALMVAVRSIQRTRISPAR